jgi:uncharacterized membrane protein
MFTFLAFVLIAYVWWLASSARRIALETSGRLLAFELADRPRTPIAPEPEPPVFTPPPVVIPSPAPEPVFVHVPPTPPPPPPIEINEPVYEPFVAPPFEPETALAKEAWESRIGGNWLNKLGALLLVIGIALFLGYSFAHMGPAGRSASAIAISAALLAAGVKSEQNETYRLFSRGLIAAGWASLYFTAYAMTSLDAAKVIDSPIAAVVLQVAVAAGMVVHSLKYKVQSLTALAFASVYAALALSSMNTFVAIALLPLAASMLFLGRRLEWHNLPILAAAATYGVFLTRPAAGAPLYAVQSMLFLFWLLFEAFDIVNRGRPILFAINAAAGVIASAVIWERMAPAQIWQFSAGAAALYLASTIIRLISGRQSRHEYSLAIAAILAAFGIFSGVPRFWTGIAYIAEAEALFLAGYFLKIRAAKWFSWPAFVIAAAAIVTQLGTTVIAAHTFHIWAPAMLILALTLHANRLIDRASSYWSYAASSFIALLLVTELKPEHLGLGGTVYALILFFAGRVTDYRLQAYALLTMGAFASAIVPTTPIAAIQLAIAYLAAIVPFKHAEEFERGILRHFGAAATAVFTGLLIWLEVPSQYAGASMMAASLALFELGLRGFPKTLRFPAVALTMTGLSHIFSFHEAYTNSRILAIAAAVNYAYVLRLLRHTEQFCVTLRQAAAWLGSITAFLAISTVLPHATRTWPIAILALTVLELGKFANDKGLAWNARALTAAAMWTAFDSALPSQMLTMSAVQWWFWHRSGGFLHGWSAAVIFVAALTKQFPDDLIGAWTAAGALFTAAARFAPTSWRNHFRLQEAVMAAITIALMIVVPSSIPQQSFAAAWLLAAVAMSKHPAHSIAATLATGIAIFHAASGGMLTVGWSLEGIGLLLFGFAIKVRTLRLAGLAVLLSCIAKAFLFDLANLDTIYRIASFIGLGLILLAVSWIYTRCRDQLQRYL